MKKGFTLIELLVVIAIIGVLATIVIASLSEARAKSRDSFRKQALTQLRNALELYYAQNNVYPSTGGVPYVSSTVNNGYYGNGPAGNGIWIPSLVAGGFISQLPSDPLGTAGTCPTVSFRREFLYVSTNGSGYYLASQCAPESTLSASDPFYDATYPKNWRVCAGADCSISLIY